MQSWRELPLDGLTPSAKKSAIRLNALGSLFYFSTVCLGYTRLTRELHGHFLCKELERDRIRLVMEFPRDHFKTTCATISASMWWALPFTETDEKLMRSLGYGDEWIRWMKRAHNTCTRTLISSETGPNVKKMGDKIEQHYLSNATFQWLFPEIQPTGKERWNQDSLIHRRLNDGTYQSEGTYDFISAQAALQSNHYERIIEDDLVGEDAVKSDSVMQGTINWHQKLPGAFDSVPGDPDALGDQIVIGNRWSHRDLNSWIRENERETYKILTHSAEGGCCDLHAPHTPIFPQEFSMNKLAMIRRTQGDYIYSCFPAGSPVLMSDWTERSIENLKVGDEIVGFTLKGSGKIRKNLVRAKVEHVHADIKYVIKATTEGGREIFTTADHKFLRAKKERYLPLCIGAAVVSVYKPSPPKNEQEKLDLAWLGGIIDGEGALSTGAIQVTQSTAKNPEVCAKIRLVLGRLGIPYTVWGNPAHGMHSHADIFTLKGRRSIRVRLLQHAQMAKTDRFRNQLWKRSANRIAESHDRIVKIEVCSPQTVYTIQSSSGNYVCQGFAVKNCHFLNDPVAPEAVRFKSDWLRVYDRSAWEEGKISPRNTANYSQLSTDMRGMYMEDLDNTIGAEPRRLKMAMHHEVRDGEIVDDIPARDLDRVLLLDPNHSGEFGRTRNAILVLGIHWMQGKPRRIYFLDAWAKASSHEEWIDAAIGENTSQLGLAFKWKVHRIYVEEVAGQAGWKFYFKERMRHRGITRQVTVLPLKIERSENAKTNRIVNMEAVYSNGLFWMPRSGPGRDLFMDEYTRYPNGATLDLLDLAGYSPQCYGSGSLAGARDATQRSANEWLKTAQSLGQAGY